ncbi:serine/threonine-protein kinase [Paenibacillus glacialis]|nr:serine/threonine-protein kinase [Paenibacillus glacialis]
MMNQRFLLLKGQIIGGRYLIQQVIGSGGMSHVYLADDLKLPGKQWAVKQCFSFPQQFTNIEDEAELLTTLSHPRLPRIVDFFPPDVKGNAYLVMDYIQGVTLEKYLSSRSGKVKIDFIIRLAEQVLDVLEYLHQHDPPIVFRDLKPSNIMLTSQLELRLIDFGIARNYKQERSEDTVKLGTVGFAAPEQYGSGQSDARSDLYGFGALLLYLVTGGIASEWSDRVESVIRRDCPNEIIPILRKCLQQSPEDRFQSASEISRTLMNYQQTPSNSPQAIGTGHVGTRVITVMGVSSGAGATHTAICIAHYLARTSSKVAIVEMNMEASAFTRIQQIVEGEDGLVIQHERRFSVEGVDYYRQTEREYLIELLGGSYNFVIMDLGSYHENDTLEEFLRADIPILVGWGSEWRMQDMSECISGLTRYPQNKWVYCLPLAPSDAVQRLRKLINSNKVYSVPLHLDPFDRCEEMDKLMNQLFKGIIPDMVKRRRFRFGL